MRLGLGNTLVNLRAKKASVNLLSGLVSHWKLNETTGERIDSTGFTDLTPIGNLNYGVGKIGNAVNLNPEWIGNEEAGYLDSISNYPLSGGFSISTWVKTVTSTSNASAVSQWSGGHGFRIGIDNLAYPTFSLASMGYVISAPVSANNWHHLVGVFNPSTSIMYFYVNGSLAGSTSTGTIDFETDGPTLKIGTLDVGDEFFQIGLVDSTSFWSRPISQAEVTKLYNGGSGLDYPF